MIFFSKFANYLRAASQKKIIGTHLKNNTDYSVTKLKFISFNGRTISFSFVDARTRKKYFLKKFLFQDKGFLKISIQELLFKKLNLVSVLSDANLLSYSSYTLNKSNDIFLRDFLEGVPLFQYCKNLNNSDFRIKVTEVVTYLKNVLAEMRSNEIFVSVDLHLHNIIILNNGNIDLIDLDLVYIDENKEDFEAKMFSKFFIKSLDHIELYQQSILFEVLEAELDNFENVKKITLSQFFYSSINPILSNFIFNNFKSFSNYEVSFGNEISVKSKLISTLCELPQNSYVVGRRYKWLLNDEIFGSKDIDIYCHKNMINEIKKVFVLNGWDVFENQISQFFESQNLLVSIDLRVDIEERHNTKFDEILVYSDKINGVNIINEYYYHKVMLHNFSNYKKFMKLDYLNDLKLYLKNNTTDLSINKEYINSKFVYKYNGSAYFSLWYFLRRIFSDVINHKDIVFIGADGSGKSTIVKILNNSISMVVSSRKRYLSGFYYPSGRTDLFFLKTSLIFKILKKLKNLIFDSSNSSNVDKNFHSKSNTMKRWRSVQALHTWLAQSLLIIFLPVIIFDAWIDYLINRLKFNRINVCDRYYDDILINYTNKYLRRCIRLLIPNSQIKFYLYAMPEEHFLRKHNEDIEMIIHMQNCYIDYESYLLKIPTNINRSFINKKLLSTVLISL